MSRVKQALAPQDYAPLTTANCCQCGRIIDTRERNEGGDDFGAEFPDGRWTCSVHCWVEATEPE